MSLGVSQALAPGPAGGVAPSPTVTKVGIDAIFIYTPEYYVDNTELAAARGEDPRHYTEGIGIKAFGVTPPNEDQASMAATAAYRLMEIYGVAPKDIFRIDTPTESGLDASRALVSDVIGMLEQAYGEGSLSHVLGYEQKFACVSGVERLLDTSAWFAAGWNLSKYAMIIATDIARYDLRSREEPTQGAAAAAVLVGANPRLLEVVPGALGSALRNEKGDFRKPEGRTVALVDGTRSYASYLSEMDRAWANFRSAAVRTGFVRPDGGGTTSAAALDSVDRAVFHNPQKKMVITAYASLLMQEWSPLPRWKSVVKEIGEEPPRDGMDDVDFYMSDAYQVYRKAFVKSSYFAPEFASKVGSSVVAPEVIGNSYSASVLVGVDSLFENDRDSLAGKTCILCGYGSGSHAIILGNRVSEEYRDVAARLDLMKRVGGRRKLSIEEYEMIHERAISASDWPSGGTRRFILTGIGGGEGTPSRAGTYREYALVN
jgi:hydroxymethylglutaryl-CoA synthase